MNEWYHVGILDGVVDVIGIEMGELDVCVLIVVIAVISVVCAYAYHKMELLGIWKLN